MLALGTEVGTHTPYWAVSPAPTIYFLTVSMGVDTEKKIMSYLAANIFDVLLIYHLVTVINTFIMVMS